MKMSTSIWSGNGLNKFASFADSHSIAKQIAELFQQRCDADLADSDAACFAAPIASCVTLREPTLSLSNHIPMSLAILLRCNAWKKAVASTKMLYVSMLKISTKKAFLRDAVMQRSC